MTTPRPRGRPPVGPRVYLRLGDDDIAALDALASDAGTTRARILTSLVRAALRRRKTRAKAPD